MPYIDFSTIEMDRCNQTIVIAAKIENDDIIHFISRWKCSAQFIEAGVLAFTDDVIPAGKRASTIRMLFPKLAQGFPGYDVHELIISHYEIFDKTRTKPAPPGRSPQCGYWNRWGFSILGRNPHPGHLTVGDGWLWEHDQGSDQPVSPRRLTVIRTHFWRGDKSVEGHHPKTVVVPIVVRVIVVATGETDVVRIVVPRAATPFGLYLLRGSVDLLEPCSQQTPHFVHGKSCMFIASDGKDFQITRQAHPNPELRQL